MFSSASKSPLNHSSLRRAARRQRRHRGECPILRGFRRVGLLICHPEQGGRNRSGPRERPLCLALSFRARRGGRGICFSKNMVILSEDAPNRCAPERRILCLLCRETGNLLLDIFAICSLYCSSCLTHLLQKRETSHAHPRYPLPPLARATR